ncbi:MAG: carbohydrate kinase family protein [archaeon]|nr:MAG: carbohydrate kinase family protein [archaeon]
MARAHDVAVMHDFYVDRLVFTSDLGDLTGAIGAKSREGGGGIHGVKQAEVRGGNAVNLAHALARLGLKTLLITHCDPPHVGMLEAAFEGLDAELRIKDGEPGLTVALEGRTNVMLSDPGLAGEFGPEILGPEDWKGLKSAKVVCSVNWAANSKGTQLLRGLRKRLGPDARIFVDPADFRDRGGDVRELFDSIRRGGTADWVSMNEQEAVFAAGTLGIGSASRRELCSGLARWLGVSFDLHCEDASYTSSGSKVFEAKTPRANPLRLTGAGDVWDAGTIFCRLRDEADEARLRFANRAARLYLASKEGLPPTESEVRKAR